MARAGDGLRLPTEAEWEHACRAGTTTAWYWGDRFDPAYAWVLDNSERRPHDPQEHAQRANAFGLIDMAGNVSEWCQDPLDNEMEGSAWNEWDPGRIHRGGSFEQPSRFAQSGVRSGNDPAVAYPGLGLRVARSL